MTIAEEINWWVSNPLILLIGGAISSGILIPYFTRRWQDHQTELNLKVDLLKELSKTVTDIVMAVEYDEDPDTSKTAGQTISEAKRDWHKGCSSIGSRIEAYFHHSDHEIGDRWAKYVKLIESVYGLPGTSGKETREEKIKKIQCALKETQGGIKMDMSKIRIIDWDILKSKPSKQDLEYLKYLDQWSNLRTCIFEMKHKLIQDIIDTDIAAFSKGLSFKKVRQSLRKVGNLTTHK